MPGSPRKRARREAAEQGLPDPFAHENPPEEATPTPQAQPPYGRHHPRRTKAQKIEDILFFCQTLNPTMACKSAGVDKKTLAKWCEQDPELSAEMDAIRFTECDRLMRLLEHPKISSAQVKAITLKLQNLSKGQISPSAKQVTHTHEAGSSLTDLVTKARGNKTPQLPKSKRVKEVIDVQPE